MKCILLMSLLFASNIAFSEEPGLTLEQVPDQEQITESLKVHSEARMTMHLAYTTNLSRMQIAARNSNQTLLDQLRGERAELSKCDQEILESELKFNTSAPDCVYED